MGADFQQCDSGDLWHDRRPVTRNRGDNKCLNSKAMM